MMSKEESKFEDCQICYNQYNKIGKHWTELHCSHVVCNSCYKEIRKSRTTMSGEKHTFVKCPFCLGTSGIEVGICPTGNMNVTRIRSSCAGFEQYPTIVINYSINQRKYYLNRMAFLPDNVDGNEILRLLTVAWDRRVSFTIGTSVTTGAEDTVVWNIHHKTNQRGGIEYFGYPDDTYFQRVKLELMQYGIE